MATRNARKIVGTVLALGAATGAIVFGSFAAWTATTSNTGNKVETGTLKFKNNTPTAKISATNVIPGQSGTETFKVANDGTSNFATVTLKAANAIGDTALQSDLNLTIKEGSTTLYTGKWNGATLASGVSLGTWNAGVERTFVATWDLPSTTTDATQGKSAGFDLVWNGTLGS